VVGISLATLYFRWLYYIGFSGKPCRESIAALCNNTDFLARPGGAVYSGVAFISKAMLQLLG